MDEGEGGNRPLASTLLQEFQNLKDKFKNEDEVQERGELVEFGTVGEILFDFLMFVRRVSISAFRKSHSVARVSYFP